MIRARASASFSLLAAALAQAAAAADEPLLIAGATLEFATAEQGRELIAEPDAFLDQLSAFDLAARAGAEKAPPHKEFLDRLRASVQAWEPGETAAIRQAFEAIKPAVEALAPPLPKSVVLVKTDGSEEPGSAYTRGAAIYVHPGALGSARGLPRLMAHELFHVISRHDPALRDRLYATIGFRPCGAIAHPGPLADLRITNPDAPVNQHAIELSVGGELRWAVPILVANAPFDPAAGRGFMDYLDLRFLAVEPRDPLPWKVAERGGKPVLISPMAAGNFREQIGGNTGYIIHPEEILADNFALLVLGKGDLPSPEIPEKMRAAFAEGAPGQ